MKNLRAIFFLLLLSAVSNTNYSAAQMNQEWIRKYNLSSNNSQVANDIITDPNGNVYVTGYNAAGYSESDMVTIKYNSSGEWQWAKIYYNPTIAFCHEKGKCLSTYNDGTKNFIYAVGDVTYVGLIKYIVIAKYDDAGNQIWIKGYIAGEWYQNNILRKITSDAAGNCYLTGGTDDKLFVAKYDSAGNQRFSVKFTNPSGYSLGEGTDIKTDSSGNIFIAGQIKSPSNFNLPVLLKYDSTGILQYYKIQTWASNISFYGVKLNLGDNGNIYLSTNKNNDYYNIKLKSNGDTIWARTYNGASNSTDVCYDGIIDAANNLYCTGIVNGLYGDVGTIKYDSSGNFQWINTYAGTGSWADKGYGIAIDASGNIFVTGVVDDSPGAKYLTLKYNSAGTNLWTNVYDFAVSDYEAASLIAVDNNGDVIAAGSCGYITVSDYAVTKYNSAGAQQWAKKYNGSQTSTDALNSITTDKNGNIYGVGRLRSGQHGDNILLLKYNSAGVKKWEYNRGGSPGMEDYGNAVATDSNGNVYITGTIINDLTNKKDVYINKLDSGGTAIFPYGLNYGNTANEEGVEIAADNSGNFYVGFNSDLNGDISFGVNKYNSAGTRLWTYAYNGALNDTDKIRDMKIDGNGFVYVTANTKSASEGTNILTIKINSTFGTAEWIQQNNGTANANDDARSIEIDNSGNVYVTGSVINSGSGNDIFAVKYNSAGTQVWSKNISNGNTLKETGAVIKYFADDSSVYISADMENYSRLNFYSVKLDSLGNGAGTIEAYSYGNTKIYGGAMNDAGYLVSAYSYDSSGSNQKFEIRNLIGTAKLNPTSAGNHYPSVNEPIAVFGSNIYAGVSTFDTTFGYTMTIVKYKSPVYRLSFQALIQGFVFPGSNTMNEDTVKIKMRNSSSPYTVVDSVKGVLDYTGTLTSQIPFYNISKNNTYYIVMNHRNSIETWSKTPVAPTPGIFYENFKIQQRVYGDNVIQVQGQSEFAVFSGDVNQDNIVDATDAGNIDNDAFNFTTGYVVTDITGDNLVDATDAAIVDNNAYNFVAAVTP